MKRRNSPIITPTNRSAGFQATDLFSTIFSVSGAVTTYNVYLASPNDGTVTGGPTITPGVIATGITQTQFNAMNFVGALNAGTDTLYLQAVGSGGTSAWVAATLTDTGAIVANPTSEKYTQPALLSQLFTVSGAVTSYNVYLASPNDGTVTGGNHAVVAGVVTEENNLSGMDFIGGLTPGADTLYLQAVTAQGTSNWVPVTVTDTGAIFPSSQTVAYNQSLSLGSVVSLSGVDSAITGFNLYLASPNDGTVTGGPTVTPGAVTFVTRAQFNAMNFVGWLSAGTDTLYAQAVTAGGAGNWVTVT